MENKELNNRLIIDVLLKTTKLTTILNMLLDANNGYDLKDETIILSSDDYRKIQEFIININDILNTNYIKVLDEIKMKGENKETNDKE